MTQKLETIIALATPPGKSGIGVIRVSGSLTHKIAKKILKQKKLQSRHAYYLPFYADDVMLDEGIAIYFQSPNSFTGEGKNCVISFTGTSPRDILNIE